MSTSNDSRSFEQRALDAESALRAIIRECWNIDHVRHSVAMTEARSCFPGNPEYFARYPLASSTDRLLSDEEADAALAEVFDMPVTAPDASAAPPADASIKRGHALSFEGGSLTIKIEGYGDADGSGHIAFDEDDLQWDDDPESSKLSRWLPLPKSELIAIRDFLNHIFPVTAPDASADRRPEASASRLPAEQPQEGGGPNRRDEGKVSKSSQAYNTLPASGPDAVARAKQALTLTRFDDEQSAVEVIATAITRAVEQEREAFRNVVRGLQCNDCDTTLEMLHWIDGRARGDADAASRLDERGG